MADEILTWDSEIEEDGEFTLLEEGDYDFKVEDFQRKTTKKGDAPMAQISFKVGDDYTKTSINEYFVLKKSVEWKISQFFRSIGLKKHGERVKMQWEQSLGKTGRCHVIVDEYIDQKGNSKTTNRIDQFYDYEEPQPVKQEENLWA